MSTVETNSVARKGRTSAMRAAESNRPARSSKLSRASEAGGQRLLGTQVSDATSNNSKGRKPRTAVTVPAKTNLASLQSTNYNSDGQNTPDTHHGAAVASPIPDVYANLDPHTAIWPHRRQEPHHTHPMPSAQRAAVALINDAWRKRQGIVRAMTKLSLQAQASLRSGRDREEAAKHYAVVAKDPTHDDYDIIVPYLRSMRPLAEHRAAYEKSLVILVKTLPIYAWAKGVSGLGGVSLAGLVGECSGYNMETDEPWSIGQMKSVSALWKRMGVAVVGGIRQQRVKGDAAIEHGYVAERRAVLWNIGECIVKAQWRKENTVHAYGKLYGEIKTAMQVRNAAGEYAEIALAIADRMKRAGSKPNPENVAGRLTAMHINNRAKRHITKRLLRDLFVEWRRMDAEARGIHSAPVLQTA